MMTKTFDMTLMSLRGAAFSSKLLGSGDLNNFLVSASMAPKLKVKPVGDLLASSGLKPVEVAEGALVPAGARLPDAKPAKRAIEPPAQDESFKKRKVSETYLVCISHHDCHLI